MVDNMENDYLIFITSQAPRLSNKGNSTFALGIYCVSPTDMWEMFSFQGPKKLQSKDSVPQDIWVWKYKEISRRLKKWQINKP